VDGKIIKRLEKIVGRENVSTEKADLVCYSFDATQQRCLAEAVVHAHSAEEVSGILRLANAEKFPVYPRGSGSGFSGGSIPTAGGVALVLQGMDKILRIDEDNMVAEVEPGLVTDKFQAAVEAKGLFYPPDPASLKFSTLGGNVAECAGGPRCVKYGVTRDYILGLEVVTPTGDIIRTGGETMKGVVGYDLTRLMVGSEGTLGVITKITVKLIPLPPAQKTMLVIFDSIRGASRAVSQIILGKIIPATLEFMDSTSIDVVRGGS
jgi:glycolate oxidase